ncbi:MAG: hypothetical protein ACOXZ4_01815 [Sphaerochaetaceae bacterium]
MASSKQEMAGSYCQVPVGVGKVAAAVNSSLFLTSNTVKHVLITGSCAAVQSQYKLGDLIIGTAVMQYDLDLSRFGLQRGATFDSLGEPTSSWISLDDTLFAKARNLDSFLGRKLWFEARLGSADLFSLAPNRNADQWLKSSLDAVDMESYAIAAAAQALGITVSLVRFVSDTESGHKAKSYAKLVKESALAVAQLVDYCTAH